jgi:hypothetical protein
LKQKKPLITEKLSAVERGITPLRFVRASPFEPGVLIPNFLRKLTFETNKSLQSLRSFLRREGECKTALFRVF